MQTPSLCHIFGVYEFLTIAVGPLIAPECGVVDVRGGVVGHETHLGLFLFISHIEKCRFP
jgi:hypothetical protein